MTAPRCPVCNGKYDIANIKLDKTGGSDRGACPKDAALAERLRADDRLHGRHLACHGPRDLLAQGAAFVDLDGPLLLAEDRTPAGYDEAGCTRLCRTLGLRACTASVQKTRTQALWPARRKPPMTRIVYLNGDYVP